MRPLFFVVALAGCEPVPGVAGPYEVVGTAVDARGEPLAGVDIVVDDTILYDAAVTTVTDEDGAYAVDLEDGSWRVYATHHAAYHGRVFDLDLHPLDPTSFAAVDGAVRDFEWRLSGAAPEPLVGFYGGTVYAYADSSIALATDLELTFTPDGPLIDGSDGEVLVRTPDAGGLVEDVPIGRYTISVRDAARGRDLKVRLQTDAGPASPEVTADFEPLWDRELCRRCLRLDIVR